MKFKLRSLLYFTLFGTAVAGCNLNEDSWHISGFKPDGNFLIPTITQSHNNTATVPILDGYSNEESESIKRYIQADKYKGKKVVLKGEIKTVGVSEGAGFFMRIDGAYKGDVLAYDDMSYGKLIGTNDWKEYKVVMFIPVESNKIVYGLKLCGKGDVWARNIELKEASESIETTGLKKPFITDQWMKAGNAPGSYEFNYNVLNQSIRSVEPMEEGLFGTLMKYTKAKELENKELELTAEIKNIDVKGWAGLWMRIDGYRHEGRKTYDSVVAFDNMHDRKIKGTNDWTSYKIHLKVPNGYKGIGYGVLLAGEGELEVRNLSLRINRD